MIPANNGVSPIARIHVTNESLTWRFVRLSLLAVVMVGVSEQVCRAAEFRIGNHLFTVPDGFEIELAAGPPLVNRPITIDFDEQGRLYASDSSGSNDKVQVQLETKPHRIVRLEDTNGDGIYDRSTVFADQMMFPEGSMWYDGSLYVAAPPSIWKLTDTDNDGVADKREEWFQGKTLTGCANDLHGPYFGPDGWIYWCKGAFAEQTYTIAGKEWKTKASHIFRCRPDGTGIEPVMTGGMDNPVDTVFLPNGDRIFTTTFLVHPGNGQRDGLIQAVYGGVYGKEQGALDGHPRTGELMPALSHLGAAAPCGLHRYESNRFGTEYVNNVFACQFNMHKVSRHVVSRNGASYFAADSDFVVSDNIDFHPTDLREDADGSLLIVDTGGWYKLCCPTSQLHKPDILGGIYRVKRAGGHSVADPRGLAMKWTEAGCQQLVDYFADDRPAVRRRAVQEIASRGDDAEVQKFVSQLATSESAVPFLTGDQPLSPREQLGATTLVWALSQLDGDTALSAVRRILKTASDDVVRQAAMHVISLKRDRQAVPLLLEQLAHESSGNRRIAAEAIGRIGDKTLVPKLLEAAANVSLPEPAQTSEAGATSSDPAAFNIDRALEHSIIYALIELADPRATASGITSEQVGTRRAALIALDQMEGGGIDAAKVIPLLAAEDLSLRETSHWIASHHPEWGDYLAGYFVERLARIKDDDVTSRPGGGKPSDADELEQRLIRFASNATIQETIAKCVSGETRLDVGGRRLVLNAMAKAKPKEMPANWGDALVKLIQKELDELQGAALEKTQVPLLASAVSTARELPQAKQPHTELKQALIKVAGDVRVAPQTRLDAMAGVAGGMSTLNEDQFGLMLASLLPDKSVEMRSAAADGIAKAKLSAEQLDRLTETIKSVGPLELDRLLVPFERSNDEKTGLKLIASLKQALALSSLRMDSLQQKLAKYGPAVQQGVVELTSILNAEAAQQKEHIDSLLPEMSKGDIRRGQIVFNSTKAACVSCHRFGYLGGSTGPDLTRIGSIRNERDLLESILYPSLSFVRSYEPVVIVLADGRVVNGLIRNETSSEILLATGPNQEIRLARQDIEEVRPSTLSVMPAGLDKQLSVQELADLVTFLKNAK